MPRRFCDYEPDPSIYELLSWDLPGIKPSHPPARRTKTQEKCVARKRTSTL